MTHAFADGVNAIPTFYRRFDREGIPVTNVSPDGVVHRYFRPSAERHYELIADCFGSNVVGSKWAVRNEEDLLDRSQPTGIVHRLNVQTGISGPRLRLHHRRRLASAGLANNQIGQRPQEGQEEDHQEPEDLLLGCRLVCQRIEQHPQPEDCGCETQDPDDCEDPESASCEIVANLWTSLGKYS